MEDKILNIIVEITGVDEVREDRDINLFDNGLFDSLAVVEFLIAVEDNFKIKIEPTEIQREDIETPNKVIEYLLKRI